MQHLVDTKKCVVYKTSLPLFTGMAMYCIISEVPESSLLHSTSKFKILFPDDELLPC
jgi:hypothetical protein